MTPTTHPGNKPKPEGFHVRVLLRGDTIEVRGFRGDRPFLRPRVMSRSLVLDARRHGQDLVGDMIDGILRDIERRETRAAARPPRA